MKADDLANLIVQTYALSKSTVVEELIIRPILEIFNKYCNSLTNIRDLKLEKSRLEILA